MPIRDLRLGRLKFVTVLEEISESVGEVVDVTGAAVTLGDPAAEKLDFRVPVRGDTDEDESAGERLRRQVRALMTNVAARASGLYLRFDQDPEQNSWLIVSGGDLKSGQGGVTFGDYELTLRDVYRVGRLATHRPARRVVATDLRTGQAPRDFLGQLFSTKFAALPGLSVTPLGISASDVVSSGRPLLATSVPTKDGPLAVTNRVVNGQSVSFEQPENALDVGGVRVFDRRGSALAAPAAAQDPEVVSGWEEVMGPAQPLGAEPPVLENGRCRLRWHHDPGAQLVPGYLLDFWDGAQWVEQGKLLVQKVLNDGSRLTLGGAPVSRVVELTAERAVVEIVATGSFGSRDRIYVTLQHGWSGPRIEVYPSRLSAAYVSRNAIAFVSKPADALHSFLKLDAAGPAYLASAGAAAVNAQIGAATFTGENWVAMLRPAKGVTVTAAVVDDAVTASSSPSSASTELKAFADHGQALVLTGPAAPVVAYLSVQFGMAAQAASEVAELEASGVRAATATIVADAAASAGQAIEETSTVADVQTVRVNGGAIRTGRYRVLVRARVVNAGATARIQVDGVTGQPVTTTTSTTYTWVDVGEMLGSDPLIVRASRSAGTGAIRLDRIELVLLQSDDAQNASENIAQDARFDGARDHGRSVLIDTRALPELVAR